VACGSLLLCCWCGFLADAGRLAACSLRASAPAIQGSLLRMMFASQISHGSGSGSAVPAGVSLAVGYIGTFLYLIVVFLVIHRSDPESGSGNACLLKALAGAGD
jgi:hypothetical protein